MKKWIGMPRLSKSEPHGSGIIVLVERPRASLLLAPARACGRDGVIT